MKKIAVIGSLNIDFVVNVAHMPAVGETILAEHFQLVPGGKGANQAYAAAKLGGDVTMLGAIGNDSYGERLTQSLSTAGVDVSRLLRLEDVSTGIALIPVNAEGDNSIIVVQGANARVDRAYIDSQLDCIRESDLVLLQLEIPLDAVAYAARIAHEMGKTVILDPAPAQPELPAALLQNVDILKPNETELAILTGDAHASEHLEESAAMLSRQGVGQVIVTLGGDGAFRYGAGGATRRFPAQPVRVVDTTAAGDSFTAAMAVALAEGGAIDDAIRFAMRVSNIVVTRAGAQTSIPSRDEVGE